MKVERFWLAGYGLILLLTLLVARVTSRAVTAMVENTPIPRENSIVIDAGHGGVDGGATSCTGILESQFNLQIALRLEALFRLLGHDTRMIRREDISVYTKGETIAQKKASDLKQRVKLVEETENAVLLSIHQNQFSDGKYWGGQVFYADTPGSEAMARQLQAAFVTHLNPGSRRREKKSSGVYLMEHVSCPAVLIECGFLSTPEEEGRLRSADYQKKLCCVIASTVVQFLSNT